MTAYTAFKKANNLIHLVDTSLFLN